MQPETYILFDSCATHNPQTSKSASAFRPAAICLAEARRVLLAERPHVLCRSTWLTIAAIAAVCHRLVVELEEVPG